MGTERWISVDWDTARAITRFFAVTLGVPGVALGILALLCGSIATGLTVYLGLGLAGVAVALCGPPQLRLRPPEALPVLVTWPLELALLGLQLWEERP